MLVAQAKKVATLFAVAAVFAGGMTSTALAGHHHHHHGIPQHNGGDHDADNNGGPSDGDGNL
jgi:hypothetical protein